MNIKCYVPMNLKKDKEVLPGYTSQDFKKAVIGAVIGIICGLTALAITKQVMFLGVVGMPIVAILVFIHWRGDTGLSCYEVLKNIVRWLKIQKVHLYEYLPEHKFMEDMKK